MKLARQLPLLLLLLLGFGVASGQNAMQVRKLKKELAKISGSKEFITATIGFCLMDVETGKILVEDNAEKSLIPASTMKLVTTGAGLALLGDTFRFKTSLQYMGRLSGDTLFGHLIVKGMGDPTLGSKRWDETNIDSVINRFNAAIKNMGIKVMPGEILIDEDNYEGNNLPEGFAVGDIPYQYGAEPSALNVFDNLVTQNTPYALIPLLDDPDGANIAIITNDDIDVYAENKKLPLSAIDSLIHLEYQSRMWDLPKDILATSNIFRLYLKYNLKKSGVKVDANMGWGESDRVLPYPTLANYYSPSLIEIASKTNESSINLYAESILRAIGIQKYGPSTLDTSIAAVKSFWKNEVGDLKGLRMTDGSGLSRSNLCTPQLFCKMLTAYTKRDNFASFYSTLPVAGKDGTVKNFAKGTAADGNAHIKSGSMSRVKCYAGYVTGKNGKLYAVSVMFNNFEPDATVTAACTTLISKVAELKGGKPKKTFVVNRGN